MFVGRVNVLENGHVMTTARAALAALTVTAVQLSALRDCRLPCRRFPYSIRTRPKLHYDHDNEGDDHENQNNGYEQRENGTEA